MSPINSRAKGDRATIERRARQGEATRTIAELIQIETDDCVIWPFAKSRGYAVVGGGKGTQLGHRIACEQRHGPPPFPGAQAAHHCGVVTAEQVRAIRAAYDAGTPISDTHAGRLAKRESWTWLT